jgi:hypothetical protein
MGESSIYAATTLEPDASSSIRLLELLPSESGSGPISCILWVARTSDLPAYTAVSYLWGDPRRTDIILVNDRPFAVRQNIWNLLDHIRREGYQGSLWIDTICIDQTSNSERSCQVALMGDIYSKATGVLSWLGLGNKEIAQAMLQLPEMAIRDKWTPDYWNEEFMKGMEGLLSRTYWTRVWIFQEFVLARELIIRCGDFWISAEMLIWVFDSCMNGHVGGEIHDRLFYCPGMKVIKYRAAHWRSEIKGWQLTTLTQISSDLKCEDVRDHVYAMLALLSDEDLLRLAIVPDYSRPVADLWTDLVLKELCVPGSQEIFYHPKQMQRMFRLADDDPAIEFVHGLLEAEWIHRQKPRSG